MKFLLLTQKPPFPVVDGGTYAMTSFLKSLKKIGSVDALVIETVKHPLTPHAKEQLAKSCNSVDSVFCNTSLSLSKFAASLFIGKSYLLNRFYSRSFEQKLNEKLKNNYDYIVFDGLFSASPLFFGTFDNLPAIAVRMHNVESEIWKHKKDNTNNPLKKWVISYLQKHLLKAEKTIFQKADKLFAISNEDLKVAKSWVSNPQKVSLLPVSVDVPIEFEPDYTVRNFFHLGAMNWTPNYEAVSYLIHRVWSDKRLQDISLLIAGENAKPFETRSNIQQLGWISNLNEFYKSAGVLVSPIRSGSGIRIKLLDAMAHGIPCITTRLGAAGIDCEKAGILLAENESDFIKHILQISENPSLRKELGQKAKLYMQEYHNFEQITTQLSAQFGS